MEALEYEIFEHWCHWLHSVWMSDFRASQVEVTFNFLIEFLSLLLKIIMFFWFTVVRLWSDAESRRILWVFLRKIPEKILSIHVFLIRFFLISSWSHSGYSLRHKEEGQIFHNYMFPEYIAPAMPPLYHVVGWE